MDFVVLFMKKLHNFDKFLYSFLRKADTRRERERERERGRGREKEREREREERRERGEERSDTSSPAATRLSSFPGKRLSFFFLFLCFVFEFWVLS